MTAPVQQDDPLGILSGGNDPLGILGAQKRPPSPTPPDMTRVGPGPVNPSAHQLTGLAKGASDLFQKGVGELESPVSGIATDMVTMAGGEALGSALGSSRVLSLIKKAPVGAIRDLATATHGGPLAKARLLSRVINAGRGISRVAPEIPGEFIEPATSVPKSVEMPAPVARTPAGRGPFLGRTPSAFSDVGEVAKVEGQQVRQPLSWFRNRAPVEAPAAAPSDASSVADVVKRSGRQSHRTQASFDDMAERMGGKSQQPRSRTNPPPAGPAPEGLPPAQSDLMESMLTKLRREQTGEPPQKWGSADVAQGFDLPKPDLEDLLRRSIEAKGGKPLRKP